MCTIQATQYAQKASFCVLVYIVIMDLRCGSTEIPSPVDIDNSQKTALKTLNGHSRLPKYIDLSIAYAGELCAYYYKATIIF